MSDDRAALVQPVPSAGPAEAGEPVRLPDRQRSSQTQPAGAETVELFVRSVLLLTCVLRQETVGLAPVGGLAEQVDAAVDHLQDSRMQSGRPSGRPPTARAPERVNEGVSEKLARLRIAVRGHVDRLAQIDNASEDELLLVTACYFLHAIHKNGLLDTALVSEQSLAVWNRFLRSHPVLIHERMDQLAGQFRRRGVALPANWQSLKSRDFPEALWFIAVNLLALQNRRRQGEQSLPALPAWPLLGKGAMDLADRCRIRGMFAYTTVLLLCRFRGADSHQLDPGEMLLHLHSDLAKPAAPLPAEQPALCIEEHLRRACQLAFLYELAPEQGTGQTVVDLAARIMARLSDTVFSEHSDPPALGENGPLSVVSLGQQLDWQIARDRLSGDRFQLFFGNLPLGHADRTCFAAANQILALLLYGPERAKISSGYARITAWSLRSSGLDWDRIRQRLQASGRYPLVQNASLTAHGRNTETLYWTVYALYGLSGRPHSSAPAAFFPPDDSAGRLPKMTDTLSMYNVALILLLERFFECSLDGHDTADIVGTIEWAFDRYGLATTASAQSKRDRSADRDSNSSRNNVDSNTASGPPSDTPARNTNGLGTGDKDTDPNSGQGADTLPDTRSTSDSLGTVGRDAGPSGGQEADTLTDKGGRIAPVLGATAPPKIWSLTRTVDKIFALFLFAHGSRASTTGALATDLNKIASKLCPGTDFSTSSDEVESHMRSRGVARRLLGLPIAVDPSRVQALKTANRITLSINLDRMHHWFVGRKPTHDIDSVTVVMDALLAVHLYGDSEVSFMRTTLDELVCLGETLDVAPICLRLLDQMSGTDASGSVQSLVDVLRDRHRVLAGEAAKKNRVHEST